MSDFLERNKVFRRTLTAIFGIIFIHTHLTVIQFVRLGLIEGEVMMSVYVGALTGGFVALINGFWTRDTV